MRLLRRRARIITAPHATGALLLAAAVAPVATVAAQGTVESSRHLWATVNVCDTERWPDTVGIRGSMPGSGDPRETMWMRFQVQFQSPVDGKWHNVPAGGDSGFVVAGAAQVKARQSGRSFRISPRKGEQVLLRGKVSFEWRVKDVVMRSASMRTQKGHKSSAGSDPPGYSAATCTVTPDS
ncbi:MAG: hypothetical protein QOD69_1121 [Solirubrobacteraceae bacterium]|jgi:hypothetical protein|nr:hypothetical protein [Solirubrobacteraceae bacterium]